MGNGNWAEDVYTQQKVTYLPGWKPYQQNLNAPGVMTVKEHCRTEADHHFNSMGQCAVCGAHRAPR